MVLYAHKVRGLDVNWRQGIFLECIGHQLGLEYFEVNGTSCSSQ